MVLSLVVWAVDLVGFVWALWFVCFDGCCGGVQVDVLVVGCCSMLVCIWVSKC